MIHELMTRADVRDQGAEAFRKGKEESDNPHFPQTDSHLEWTSGFMTEKHKGAVRQA
ncbi:hypothetical protein [Cupriavidus pauculus]|uniref:hypothetical protein n=1 Tax=Cupriavidus pauculus TaxID=82633 RepID=UPI0015DE4D6E|nr:hypothetical protein [Cupriavidus pauculus]